LYFRRLQKSYSAAGFLFKVLSSGTPSWPSGIRPVAFQAKFGREKDMERA
jgi:hypothetical protein